jgi:hypothetical protein
MIAKEHFNVETNNVDYFYYAVFVNPVVNTRYLVAYSLAETNIPETHEDRNDRWLVHANVYAMYKFASLLKLVSEWSGITETARRRRRCNNIYTASDWLCPETIETEGVSHVSGAINKFGNQIDVVQSSHPRHVDVERVFGHRGIIGENATSSHPSLLLFEQYGPTDFHYECIRCGKAFAPQEARTYHELSRQYAEEHEMTINNPTVRDMCAYHPCRTDQCGQVSFSLLQYLVHGLMQHGKCFFDVG